MIFERQTSVARVRGRACARHVEKKFKKICKKNSGKNAIEFRRRRWRRTRSDASRASNTNRTKCVCRSVGRSAGRYHTQRAHTLARTYTLTHSHTLSHTHSHRMSGRARKRFYYRHARGTKRRRIRSAGNDLHSRRHSTAN